MGLAGTLALLASSVAALFGVALSVDEREIPRIEATGLATQPPAAELDSKELLELGLERAPVVARRVAEIRGIEFDEVPKPKVTDAEDLGELAARELDKPKVAKQLAASDAELKLVGLLEPDESLADVATEVTANAVGFYDPKKKELFLLGDAVPAGAALAEFILAHELNHALEDQEFGLPESSASSDDRVLAESALVEGSATALMTEYAARHLEPSDLFAESAALQGESGDLPPIALAQVSFSYVAGQQFVNELRAAVDGSWDLVDFAYEGRPPETTEQILHPEKFLDNEGALRVPKPADAGRGWVEADSGTVGEFFTRELLRLDATETGADEAAAGWGGDRYRFFWREDAPRECSDTCRVDSAMATVWRGDDVGEAAELKTALEDYVERALEGEEAGSGVWELDEGWASVEGSGDVVSLALAPSKRLAQRLAAVG